MAGRAVGMTRRARRVEGLAGAHLGEALGAHHGQAPLRHGPLAAHALEGDHQRGAGPMMQQVTGQAALAQLQMDQCGISPPASP